MKTAKVNCVVVKHKKDWQHCNIGTLTYSGLYETSLNVSQCRRIAKALNLAADEMEKPK